MKYESDWRRWDLTFDNKCYRLYDLINIIGGGTPKTSVKEYWNGDIPWLSVKDFGNDDRYVYVTEKNISIEGLKKSSTKMLKKNDIIISARGTVGELAMLPFPMAFNQSCYGVRPNNKLLDNTYLYYLMKNSVALLKSNAHGSVFDTITRDTFKEIEISLPPLTRQKEIAHSLSILDDKIEINKKINHHLEEMALTLFENEFSNVAVGSHYVGEYIKPKRGKGLLSKNAVPGEIPVIAGGLKPATYHNVANTDAPVITISASGANAGFVKLWNVPVWSSDSSFIDSSMTKNVYFWYVMLKKRQQEIYDSQTGSAQPHIYPKHIENLSTMILNNTKLESYNNQVTPLFEEISANLKENQSLKIMRDTLLPKLMSNQFDESR